MKKYLFLAASALALASCSSDDIIANNGGGQQNATGSVIQFNSNAGPITRATSNIGTDPQKLDYQFKMYGVKKVETKYQDVFQNYSLWDETANNTTTNTNGWEYVGNAGTHGTGNVNVTSNQTIKYWDYSSEDYRFVAGSPIANFTFNKGTDGSIESATVSGLAGHITANANSTAITTNPVYIAEPKVVAKSDYNKVVKFNFVRQQSKVRVGIYETIPGYKITDITFYKQGESGLEISTEKNIILTSETANYFVGSSEAKGTVTYDWTKPSYTFEYDDTNLTKAKNWYAGALNGVKATSSVWTSTDEFYGTDNDREDNGYFTVIPTPSATDASAILIKCNYTLTSEDNSGETIKVTGATAAIPAAFSKWEPNVMYTYIFKISQNTNGTTGTPETDPEGLFPITFDAVVADFTEKDQGTITTIATPSITTYQVGSVTNLGVEYKANKTIYAVVAVEKTGVVKELTTNDVQVYKLTEQRNEADLQISKIIATELIPDHKVNTGVPSTNTTVGTVTLTANEYLEFTPDAEGWYAIQYKTADNAYAYKIVHVAAAE